jgi:hypothetical protein
MRDAYADTSQRLTQRKLDIATLSNAALERLLRPTITDAQYKPFVEPNMREADRSKSNLPHSRRSTSRWKKSPSRLKLRLLIWPGHGPRRWKTGSRYSEASLERIWRMTRFRAF